MAKRRAKTQPQPLSSPQPSAPPSDRWGRAEWLLAALLAAALLALGPTLWGDFLDYDDPGYVTSNPHVQKGLTGPSLKWAWTTTHEANWHPLTWMSLMLDVRLFGTRVWGYHLTNLLLHAANTVLLFALLRRLSGATGRSALVAALFALHPLHVESVAWVAERKDVLCTFFGFAAMWAYGWYAQGPSLGRYAAVLLLMALSLLAKPMFVTLPCLLLLLDYWPLRRWQSGGAARRLVVEKLPLAALSVASCCVTVWAQRRPLGTLEDFPVERRLANAVISYLQYLRQTFVPTDLAVFYPYPEDLGVVVPVAAGVALLTLTAAALYWGRRWPYLSVGWLWYVGMLVPVIGLVQVGAQARADRYTYVPLVGIFIILVWGATDLVRHFQRERLAGALAAVVLIFLGLTSCAQTFVWRDGVTLWKNALKQTGKNWLACIHLGELLRQEARQEPRRSEKARLYKEALAFFTSLPQDANTRTQIGLILIEQGEPGKAEDQFRQAMRDRPDYELPHFSLAYLCCQRGKPAEAVDVLRGFMEHYPATPQAHDLLATALRDLGQPREAAAESEKAVALQPDAAALHFNLGGVRQQLGDWPAAEASYRRAAALQPRESRYHRALAFALFKQGNRDEARAEYQVSVQLDPTWPWELTRRSYQAATARQPVPRLLRQAEQDLEQVRQAKGAEDPMFLDALAAVYAALGRFDEAIDAARRAVKRASAVGPPEMAQDMERRLRLYEKKQPYHEESP
jgi:tetratricopeptide (TPR) repeat protein